MMKNIESSKDKYITLKYTAGEDKPTFGVFEMKRRKFNESYFSMFQDALVVIARLKLPGTTCWVFNYLCGKMEFDNAVHIPQKAIAAALEITQANVSKAINQLVLHEILIPGPTIGALKTYTMNNKLCWKGRVKNLDKARLSLI